MTHTPSPAHITASVQRRIAKLPTIEHNGIVLIKDFGMFIDTHRDQPHIGSFASDIHRGACLPTMVDYVVTDDALRRPEDGKLLARHDKHQFITPERWSEFLLNELMTRGDPRAGDGSLPTSHFRDARKGIYVLRSFRQMVDYHFAKP